MDPQLASGGGCIEKEDLCDEEYLCQVKSSRVNSISIKVTDFEALVYNAQRVDKRPMLLVDLMRKKVVKAPRKWVMIPIEEWRRLNRE